MITGISGFVGSYLAKDLLKRGADVWGLLRFRADRVFPRNLSDKAISGEVKLVEGDIADLYSLLSAFDRARPEFIFHLAAQSFVHRSFTFTMETAQINSMGTANLLEAVRMKAPEARVVFAGSSEEYGMVFLNQEQYDRLSAKRNYFPPPAKFPELPINESNPLRPISPYAVSKVHGDFLMRQYHISYGLNTVVSRAFNHEGAGRGGHFVTSQVAKQVAQMVEGEVDRIVVGNISAFRDWSHVSDIIRGYELLAEKGKAGEVYNQGSERTNSVLGLVLLAINEAGYVIKSLRATKGDKEIESPADTVTAKAFGREFPVTRADQALLDGKVDFTLDDQGLVIATDKGDVPVLFDQARFRPSDVPILFCDATKARSLGFATTHSIPEIIRDQINYFLSPENLEGFMV